MLAYDVMGGGIIQGLGYISRFGQAIAARIRPWAYREFEDLTFQSGEI